MREKQLKDKFIWPFAQYLEGTDKFSTDQIKRLSNPFYMDEGVSYHKINLNDYFSELLVLPSSIER